MKQVMRKLVWHVLTILIWAWEIRKGVPDMENIWIGSWILSVISVLIVVLWLCTFDAVRKFVIVPVSALRIADWMFGIYPKSFTVHYMEALSPSRTQIGIRATYRCNIGTMTLVNIELQVARHKFQYCFLGKPEKPYHLPMVVSGEKEHIAVFDIVEQLDIARLHNARIRAYTSDKNHWDSEVFQFRLGI